MVAMKNALLKDTLREIWRTFSRFLSIFAIVALGVAFFAGVKATSTDMRITGDQYFDEYHLMDIRLVSTLGFNDKDIEAMTKTEGLEYIQPGYSLDSIAEIKGKEMVVKLLSLPSNNPEQVQINKTKLIDGRYPEKANECLIEEAQMLDVGTALGSKIRLSSGNEKDISENLENSEFTIVGIVETPYYISYDRGTSSVGNGKVNSFIMMPVENFKLPVYTEVFLTVKNAREAFAYDDKYKELIKTAKGSLETVAESREQQRYDEIMMEADDKLIEGRLDLENAEAEATDKLNKAAKELESGKKKLIAGEREFADKESSFKATIKDAENKIAAGYKELEEGEKEYLLQLDAFNQAKDSLPIEVAAATEAKLQEISKVLEGNRIQLETESQRIASTTAKAEAEFAAGRKKLATSKAELEKGEKEYTDAKLEADEKLADARAELLDAEKQLEDIEKPTWYVLDRNANPGFVDYEFSADRIAAIAQVFPVFFFLIAALVCLTTMTRMVDEQRNYIGTLKALGYSKFAIVSKYLIYAALASIGGSIFGMLVGFKLFPTVIFNAYSIMFTMPPVIAEFNTYYAILSIVLAASITIMAAWFACVKELRAEPAKLMRPKSPKAGKRIWLERAKFIWVRLNFTQKITARNIFRYKKRFLMTVLGIGGCTALLLAGFGLKDSILSIAAIQFDELYKYDMIIQLKKDIVPNEKNSVIEDVSNDSRISDYMMIKEQSIDIGSGDIEKSVYLVVPESTKRLEDFIDFRIRGSKRKVPFTETGVILGEKLAKQLQAVVGDEIYIKTDGDKKVNVKVDGITEHYISHYMYMSPKLYQEVFGKQVQFKQVMAKTTDTTEAFENRLSSDMLKNEEVSSIRFTTGISKDFKKIIKSLNYVILVMIFSAGALAFIVLYNLTNVNVTERLREIATIKVLGFYDREVSAYVDRESVLLTIIGMLAGLILGIFFHRFIIVTAEVEYVMFGRIIKPLSYVYAAILTMVFSLLVNLVIHFKLKKIDMVESLKSVD
jgi:putative ABC transport system permease protein